MGVNAYVSSQGQLLHGGFNVFHRELGEEEKPGTTNVGEIWRWKERWR
jgi:hypothetical protein